MEGKGEISEYRSKLDKTLASPDLTNEKTVHTLVKNQVLQSLDSKLGEYSDYVVEKRSKQVFDFLRELRSVNDERLKPGDESNKGWKVKQDTHELRVMYREGPEGTPYHSLLCEGYVDGPVDVCMCISIESDLYKKWWPQIVIPTFRVISSQRVQKVRVGEQISVVRMKLSWPMSSREALIHYFMFEYIQDGLVVVLLNSIPDSENIDRSTHGFTREGIPDPQDVVRMDLFGGFALQKVSHNRSYFRTIANMDIKLDFVPPAIINFIARQLVGSGFKLYKKEVGSVSKADAKFREALKDPLYTRMHNALYSENGSMASPALDDTLEEQSSEALKDNSAKENDGSNLDLEDKVVGVQDGKVRHEIEEFEEKQSDRPKSLDEGNEIEEFEVKDSDRPKSLDGGEQKDSDRTESLDEKLRDNFTDRIKEEVRSDKMEVNRTEVEQGHEITEHFEYGIKTKVGVSREVRQALETLEKAISVFRECKNNPGKGQFEVVKRGNLLNLEKSISSKKSEACVESSKIGSAELTSHAPRRSSDSHGSRHKGSNSFTRETNQSKIAPVSPDEGQSSPSHVKHIDLHSSTVVENKTESRLPSAETKRKNKKAWFCCLSFSSS